MDNNRDGNDRDDNDFDDDDDKNSDNYYDGADRSNHNDGLNIADVNYYISP